MGNEINSESIDSIFDSFNGTPKYHPIEKIKMDIFKTDMMKMFMTFVGMKKDMAKLGIKL